MNDRLVKAVFGCTEEDMSVFDNVRGYGLETIINEMKSKKQKWPSANAIMEEVVKAGKEDFCKSVIRELERTEKALDEAIVEDRGYEEIAILAKKANALRKLRPDVELTYSWCINNGHKPEYCFVINSDLYWKWVPEIIRETEWNTGVKFENSETGGKASEGGKAC